MDPRPWPTAHPGDKNFWVFDRAVFPEAPHCTAKPVKTSILLLALSS